MKKGLIVAIAIVLSVANWLYPVGETYEGYSSWYGGQFHGRKTASGETFDMHKLTAAHRTLPFGTYVRVQNLHNNKELVVRVNDRGPFKADRIIDVSKEAATQLGFIDQGLARVKITILGKNYQPDSKPDVQLPSQPTNEKSFEDPTGNEIDFGDESSFRFEENDSKPRIANKQPASDRTETEQNNTAEIQKIPGSRTRPLKVLLIQTSEAVKKSQEKIYKLQLGAYSSFGFAMGFQKKMDQKGIPTQICLFSNDSSIFRVLTQNTFKNQNDAVAAQKQFLSIGIKCFVLEL